MMCWCGCQLSILLLFFAFAVFAAFVLFGFVHILMDFMHLSHQALSPGRLKGQVVPGPPVLVMSRMQEGEAASWGVVPVAVEGHAAIDKGAVSGAAPVRPDTGHVRGLGPPGGGRTDCGAANPG